MRTSCDYLFVTHRLYVEGKAKIGGLDRTKEYLLAKGHRIVLVENPLTTYGDALSGGFVSRISLLEGSKSVELATFSVWPRKHPWRWFREPSDSAGMVRKLIEPGFAAFAGDPLSGLVCQKLRKSGDARVTVLHCTDYARDRFSNPVLNLVYNRMYRFVVSASDHVLCVSSRMADEFNGWSTENHCVHFPNTPDADQMPVQQVEARKRNRIVLLGASKEGMDHRLLINGLARLRASIPDIQLLMIAGGGSEDVVGGLASAAGVADIVERTGFLPREKALEMVAGSYIGFVYYNETEGFNHYRDSIKIREYTACGLPVISDLSTETAQDGIKAGACIGISSEDEFVKAVQSLQDPKRYAEMSRNALSWARANDKRRYLDDLYAKLGGRQSSGPEASKAVE